MDSQSFNTKLALYLPAVVRQFAYLARALSGLEAQRAPKLTLPRGKCSLLIGISSTEVELSKCLLPAKRYGTQHILCRGVFIRNTEPYQRCH